MDNHPNPIDFDPEEARKEAEAFARFGYMLDRLTPRALITPGIVILNCLIFAIMVATGVSAVNPGADALIKWGANFGPRTMRGEEWRLVTCMFLHIGLLHLALNMWCLYGVGQLLERLVGPVGFLLLYLLSGVGGSLASCGWAPTNISAGASGAVFGVYGALLGVYLRAKATIPVEVLKSHRSSTTAFLLYNLAFGFFIPSIDMAAHLGGLFCGFLCGLALGHPITPQGAARRTFRNVATLLAGALLLGTTFYFVRERVQHAPESLDAALLRELKSIDEIQDHVSEVFADAWQEFTERRIGDAQLLEIVENDVLPPWHESRQRFSKLHVVPEKQKAFEQIKHYQELREESWELLCQALRKEDPQMMEQFMKKMQETNQLIKESRGDAP